MCETHAYDYAAFGRLIVPTALKSLFQTAFILFPAFKATSNVGTISFVKTKRNRTHETRHALKTSQAV